MNAHPHGCDVYVQKQIQSVKEQISGQRMEGPRNVLIIGASSGYGLASRIVSAFGYGANTLGVSFEKTASKKRTATSGWYADEAFLRYAHAEGVEADTIIGDAFSYEIKNQAIEKIKKNMGTVDLVVYSLASGVRTDPVIGKTYRSVIKPIGKPYTAKSLDPMAETIGTKTLEPATDEETDATVRVMGGEDWSLWMDSLIDAGVLGPHCVTVSYSYIGPEITYPIYREGTIGKAKEHLESTIPVLNDTLKDVQGKAFVSINKALVTKASSVIPAVPLYISILFDVMKKKGIHEGTIEQIYRLFSEGLYSGGKVPTDDQGRIRVDDYEMREDVQREVKQRWDRINENNIKELTDLEGYKKDFLQLHGFGFDEIDYDKDVSI